LGFSCQEIEQDEQYCFDNELKSLHHTFEREYRDFGRGASLSHGVGGEQHSAATPIHGNKRVGQGHQGVLYFGGNWQQQGLREYGVRSSVDSSI
jgi:hypothetical protein